MEWEIVPRDEQETLIKIDYCEKTINVYTSRKQVGERLKKKIGEPTDKYVSNGKIYAVNYKRNLFDKDVSKFLSKMLLIGAFRDDNGVTNELVEENKNNED